MALGAAIAGESNGWVQDGIDVAYFLGLWFLYQLFEANFGLFAARANGGGTAFLAHVGGFVFGVIVARALASSGKLRAAPGEPAAVGAAP